MQDIIDAVIAASSFDQTRALESYLLIQNEAFCKCYEALLAGPELDLDALDSLSHRGGVSWDELIQMAKASNDPSFHNWFGGYWPHEDYIGVVPEVEESESRRVSLLRRISIREKAILDAREAKRREVCQRYALAF